MRLEDWQRWLDTQFIDHAKTQPQPEPQPSPEPPAPGRTESDSSSAAAHEAAPTSSAVAVLERPAVQQASAVAALASPVAPPEAPPPAPPAPAYPSPSESAHPASVVAPQPKVSHVEDPQIPSLEQYMPFLRQRVSAPEPRPEEMQPSAPEDEMIAA